MKTYRYPGVRPFEAADSALFFGRDRDIADLYEMLRAERLVVLFGKSGYGKSSLLNAGVLPRLKPVMTTVEVRLGEYIEGQSLEPMENLRRKAPVQRPLELETAFLQQLPPSLWTHFKQLDSGEKGSYLLVFDQFEEFFSYPAEQQRTFRDQLADLLSGDQPDDLREVTRALDRDQRRLLAAPMDIRLLFSIRSDRLHELDRLKDRLPAILHKRYELKALSRDQAREAIVQPALLGAQGAREAWTAAGISFFSPPFEYREDALQKILAGLAVSNTAQQSGVEAFQLQILCDSIESKVSEGLIPDNDAKGLANVTAEDLPDFTEVFAQYYERRLGHLPETQRVAARRVIEDGLVRYDPSSDEGRRLSVDGQALLKDFEYIGLSPELLRELENTFLVRREPNTLGGHNYELSHDTLLAPVVRAKKRRMAEEAERWRLESITTEEARIVREKAEARRRQRRALVTSFVAGMLVLAALVATLVAFQKTKKADEKTSAAVVSDSLAQVKTRAAAISDSLALQKTKQAMIAEQKSALAQKIADLKTKEAKTAAHNAELKKTEAQLAALQAVEALLDAARKDILFLRYDAAFSKMKDAAGLGTVQDSVAFELMEIAYFRYHSGQVFRAAEPLSMAANLLGQPDVPLKNDMGDVMARLDKKRYNLLVSRYFPDMADIKGGIFTMGSDASDTYGASPAHQVTVSNFQMAKTETTVWQYNLYLAALGQDINNSKVIERPGWGWEGDNPIVNVSWYDAIRYANWLSRQQQPALTSAVDTSDGDFEPVWSANGYRLPTEAEWEYAAKGAVKRDTFEYSGSINLDVVAWYIQNSGNRTHAVATKKVNGAGLFDMSGNVWEWCWDWYRDYTASPITNPKGPRAGDDRVYRGGSWGNTVLGCHAVYRNNGTPNWHYRNLGFRLVRPL